MMKTRNNSLTVNHRTLTVNNVNVISKQVSLIYTDKRITLRYPPHPLSLGALLLFRPSRLSRYYTLRNLSGLPTDPSGPLIRPICDSTDGLQKESYLQNPICKKSKPIRFLLIRKAILFDYLQYDCL